MGISPRAVLAALVLSAGGILIPALQPAAYRPGNDEARFVLTGDEWQMRDDGGPGPH